MLLKFLKSMIFKIKYSKFVILFAKIIIFSNFAKHFYKKHTDKTNLHL